MEKNNWILNERFDKRILKAGMIPNIVSAAVMFLYDIFFISMKLKQLPWAILILVVIVGVAEFLLSPLTNGILTTEITNDIASWEENGLPDFKKRTVLFENVMSFPLKKAFQTFLYFFSFSFLLNVGYFVLPTLRIDIGTCLVSFVACSYGSYFAALVAYTYSENICTMIAEKIVMEGVDEDYVYKKKNFGLPIFLRSVLYLIAPAVFSTVVAYIVLRGGYKILNGHIPTAGEQIFRIIMVVTIGIVTETFLAFQFLKAIKQNAEKLSESLIKAIREGSSEQYSQTAISDKNQYNVFLLNRIIKKFNALLVSAHGVGKKVLRTTDNLSVVAGQLSSTSLEQSASVKEILATMEDSTALSQNISDTINTVSVDSEKTFQDVSSGFEVLKSIMSQMAEIDTANVAIIDGIRDLEKQISNIGNVISIINDIADQTRIIAFNAELEAVSAGNEGHNFHIVATEIRRLANSTVESITEIKDYIQNIQGAAQRLIASSQVGTNLIQEETELAHELENHFEGIRNLSDVTATKSNEISDIVNQQTSSFNQIVITLRQISASIEGFTSMTQTINETAIQMQEVASNLSALQKIEETNDVADVTEV